MGLLEGKVAVITGAGSGMAKASVAAFVEEGARVVAGDISGAERDTAAECGPNVVPVHCDVTREADIVRAVPTVRGRKPSSTVRTSSRHPQVAATCLSPNASRSLDDVIDTITAIGP